MNKLLLIIKREYLSRVRKKSFIIMTFLTPLFMVGIFVIPTLIAINNEDSSKIAVIDENDFDEITLKSTDNLKVQYFNQLSIETNKSILLESYDFLIHIPQLDSIHHIENKTVIYSNNQMSLSIKLSLESQFDKLLTNHRLVSKGIDLESIKSSESNTTFITYVVDDNGEDKKGNSEASFGIGLIGGFMIYIFIFMYGTMVMRSIIEEKTNRIVEIIISSVKPFELMMGKIVSVALVGLSQFAMWLILGSIFIFIANGILSSELDISNINGSNPMLASEISDTLASLPLQTLFSSFIIYFLGGYLLYGSLFAAIGSVSDQETDSQQFILPITIPLILSFILVQVVIDNPHSSLAYWLSMIPFTSPIIMMARIPFGVPIHELILSVSLLIIGFLLTTWFAAKIYRVGILMYGKKINYKELWKWLKYND